MIPTQLSQTGARRSFRDLQNSNSAYIIFSISIYRIAIMLSGSNAIIPVSQIHLNVDLGDSPSFRHTCAYTSSGALVILHLSDPHLVEAGSKRQGILPRPHPVAFRLHVTSSRMLQLFLAQVKTADTVGWDLQDTNS